MNARERAETLLLGVLIAAATHGAAFAAATKHQADPHELYATAKARLEAGRLDDAAALLQKLTTLVAARPQWDPDGTFTKDLVPPLRARLNRLQSAAAALDAFRDQVLREVHPPDFKQDLSTVKDYTQWATTEVARLRSERDALVAQRLPNREDVAILMRTESYARSERLLEVDLLAKMSDAAGDDILGLLSGDPRLESVLTRFRQLKRDVIQATEEKNRLQESLKQSEERDRALLSVLEAILGDGVATPAPAAGRADPADAGAVLSRVLVARREALGGRSGLADGERALAEADLARFRLANRLIVEAGLGADQRTAITRLDRAIAALPRAEDAPASEGPAAPAKTAPAPDRPSTGTVLLALASAAAVGAFLYFRTRRESNARAGEADAGRRAA